jgi:hypothetical protein
MIHLLNSELFGMWQLYVLPVHAMLVLTLGTFCFIIDCLRKGIDKCTKLLKSSKKIYKEWKNFKK